MAFGHPITDGERVAIGTYGYVLRFNLKPQEPALVQQVQLQNALTNVLSDLFETPSTIGEVFSLPQDTQTSVDLAWCQQGNDVFVFVRTLAHAFVSTTRIAFWLYRNAFNVVLTTDQVDVPQEARALLVAMSREQVYLQQGLRVPFDVQNAVRTEWSRLGLG